MKRLALTLSLLTLLVGCGGEARPELFPVVEGWFCANPGSSHCLDAGVMLYCSSIGKGGAAFWERVQPASSCKKAD